MFAFVAKTARTPLIRAPGPVVTLLRCPHTTCPRPSSSFQACPHLPRCQRCGYAEGAADWEGGDVVGVEDTAAGVGAG